MPIRMPKVEYDVVELGGGLDQITPSLSLTAGVVRDGINYECSPAGGYSRIGGYERVDGQPAPSAAVLGYLQVATFTNTPTVGQTLTGATSGATAYIVAVGANYLVLTKYVGAFSAGEVLMVGPTTIGTSVALSAVITPKQQAVYQAAAADVYRANILAVPGSGKVQGVFAITFGGVDQLYAFRANAGGTATNLYVATAGGWSLVPYKHEISFTLGGTVTPVVGEVLTQGGVTATVRRVMASSGSWAGQTAAGRIIIDVPAGGVFAAGNVTLPTSGAIINLSGASSAITMSPGGTFEIFRGNFTGQASTIRAYGCDGVNRCFEFDGTTFAPIVTGTSPDTPKHIIVHMETLVVAIQGSLIISGPGLPYRFLPVDGGVEIAAGDNITGFLIQPGAQSTAALLVYASMNTFVLYGTGASTWNFVRFNTGTGGVDYTCQNMAQSYTLSTFGVTSLVTTQFYGNFLQSTLTNNIKTFILGEVKKAAYSCLSRVLSQYRLFFTDGYGLYVTVVNGKLLGSMPVYFPNPVACAWESVTSTNSEVSYFGSTNGFVYQLDVGSSFDGATLDAFITLNWNAVRSPRVLKRWRHSSIEMQGNYYADVSVGYQFGYGTMELAQPSAVLYTSGFTPAPNWDSFIWDSFTWDGRTIFPTEVDLNGTSENLQVTISSTGNYIYPYTVNSIINHYSSRRGMR